MEHNGCDPALGEQSDPAGLALDFRKRASDLTETDPEEAASALSRDFADWTYRYLHMNLEVVLHCLSVRDGCDYHLILRAVPDGWPGLNRRTNDVIPSGDEGDRDGDFVFLGITKLVHSPEKWIPSFIWLKRHHRIKDFFRNVLGSTSSSTLHFRQGISERELSAASGAVAVGPCSNESGLVQRIAHGAERVRNDAGQGGWKGFSQLDLMKIATRIRIDFNNDGVWAALTEPGDFPLKVLNLSLGVVDAIS